MKKVNKISTIFCHSDLACIKAAWGTRFLCSNKNLKKNFRLNMAIATDLWTYNACLNVLFCAEHVFVYGSGCKKVKKWMVWFFGVSAIIWGNDKHWIRCLSWAWHLIQSHNSKWGGYEQWLVTPAYIATIYIHNFLNLSIYMSNTWMLSITCL